MDAEEDGENDYIVSSFEHLLNYTSMFDLEYVYCNTVIGIDKYIDGIITFFNQNKMFRNEYTTSGFIKIKNSDVLHILYISKSLDTVWSGRFTDGCCDTIQFSSPLPIKIFKNFRWIDVIGDIVVIFVNLNLEDANKNYINIVITYMSSDFYYFKYWLVINKLDGSVSYDNPNK